MAVVPATLWRLRAQACLHWRNWDDQWVVFNEASGQTHLLDAVTTAILSVIEKSPSDVPNLTSVAMQESGLHDESSWSTTVSAVLERLTGVGLIESITP